MKPEIVLGELKPEDHHQYCYLLSQLTDCPVAEQELFDEQLKTINSNPLHHIVIARSNDKIIGTITILIEPKIIHGMSYVGHIEDYVVDKDSRGLGVGKLLLEHAIKICRVKCYKVILDTKALNVDFYRRFGFEIKQSQLSLYF
jgi:glucosamine-phosphate N-acetyltransferase